MKRKLLALLFLTLTITAILCGCSHNTQPSEQGIIFGLTGNSELAIIGDLIDADKIPAGTQQVFARYTHTEPGRPESQILHLLRTPLSQPLSAPGPI